VNASPAAVFFDCDGVLVDSEPLVNRIFVSQVAETGPRLDEAASYLRFTGSSMRARLDAIREDHRWSPPDGFLEEFDRRLAAAVRTELAVVPGVREVLAALELPRGVVSNGSRAEVEHRLLMAGLRDAFGPDAITSGADDVARPKPFPDVYLHAASRMGAAPAACVVVEDSAPGVRAAVAAGMRALGFAPRGDGSELACLGATVFHHMRELPALLGS